MRDSAREAEANAVFHLLASDPHPKGCACEQCLYLAGQLAAIGAQMDERGRIHRKSAKEKPTMHMISHPGRIALFTYLAVCLLAAARQAWALIADHKRPVDPELQTHIRELYDPPQDRRLF